MRFSSTIQLITPDGTVLAPADFANPRTAPGAVKRAFVHNAPRVPGGTALNSRWAFIFESDVPATDTIVFDIWTADEVQQQGVDVPDIGDLVMADIKWYSIAALTDLAPLPGTVLVVDGPPSGLFYCEVTAMNITTPVYQNSYLKVEAFHG